MLAPNVSKKARTESSRGDWWENGERQYRNGDCFSPYPQLYANDAMAIENEALLNNKTTGA
jgi:hypothetical protein